MMSEADRLAAVALARNGGRKEEGGIRRVPGEVAPIGRLSHESATFESSLRRMPLPALGDVLDRQRRLLADAKLVKSLPDGGERVRRRAEHVENLILARQKSEADAASLLSALSLNNNNEKDKNPHSKTSLEEMEFKLGGGLASHLGRERVRLDSDDDDDDEDPLRVHAQKEVPNVKKSARPDVDRVANGDREGDDDPLFDEHSKALSARVSKAEGNENSSSRFVPSFSLKHERVDEVPTQLKKSARPVKNRTDPIPLAEYERSGARPRASKGISLQESVRIQQEQEERMRRLNLERAVERLSRDGDVSAAASASKLPESLASDMRYRDVQNDDDEEEEDEVRDDEDEVEKGVNVTFTEYQTE